MPTSKLYLVERRSHDLTTSWTLNLTAKAVSQTLRSLKLQRSCKPGNSPQIAYLQDVIWRVSALFGGSLKGDSILCGVIKGVNPPPSPPFWEISI